jgi:outer membrane receptor protein involved in Fe transport
MAGQRRPEQPLMTASRAMVAAVMTVVLVVALGSTTERLGAQARQDGTISGVVRDESGGVLPGVVVTATVSGGQGRSAVTSGDGHYSIAVSPGVYVVSAQLSGFAPFSSNAVSIGPGLSATVDVTLELPTYGDTVVVTGSRTPESLRTAPVAVTVLRSAEIENTPATNYSDLLRSVPGVNVIELSPRDVQIVARGASGRNARNTLALLDGRSVYQDYFGMVLWDLLPVDFDDLKQIEVARGPGSAIWGANALTGAINLITRSPREMIGTRVKLGIGERSTREAGISHAGEAGRLAYRLSGSYYNQDRWDRPAAAPDGTALPPYQSIGTTQYKADVRVDFDRGERSAWRFDGGYANSNGLIIVAPGPYDAHPMRQAYGAVEYTRKSASLSAATSIHSAQYAGLLTTDAAEISSQSLQLDARDTRVVRGRHLIVYGGSFKHSHFDLSFVPDVNRREEAGGFVTDDVHLNDRVRLTVGTRLDWFDTFGLFASPRLGVRFEPSSKQTFRLTYNRAYVAPSTVESFANFPSSIEIPLGAATLPVRITTTGNRDLRPQTIDAFEIGYSGLVGDRVTVSAAVYQQRSNGVINLTTAELYSSSDPPAGWPLPAALLDGLGLPKLFRWGSVGNLSDYGIEAGMDWPVAAGFSASANYSFQSHPDVTGVDGTSPPPVNIPPHHRINVSVSGGRRWFSGSLTASYTGRAFWTDVLAIQGWTDDFWLLSGTAAASFRKDHVTWSIKGTNLANQPVQHHIFGDVIRRRVLTEMRFRL